MSHSTMLPPSAPPKSRLLIALALVVLTVVSFLPVLECEFIRFDDPAYVTENPHVLQGLTAESVAWAFQTSHAANWHPLTWLSLMLDVELFRGHPSGFHAVNLAIHAANV